MSSYRGRRAQVADVTEERALARRLLSIACDRGMTGRHALTHFGATHRAAGSIGWRRRGGADG